MPSGAVAASMIGSGGMAVAKLTAAAFSGSSGMFADGIRSGIDCANDSLMALGQHRSKRPPDELHPFGHGKELYFWTLIVATNLFAVAGLGTVAKGVFQIVHPKELENVGWNYAVLGTAICLAGYSWWKAFKEFRAGQGNRSFGEGVEKAKDPTTLTALFDSSASLVGLPVAFLGVLLSDLLHAPVFDGVASVFIGLLMAAVAVFLVYQSKQLLVGESAAAELKKALRKHIEADDTIEGVRELVTMHLGPQEILAIAVVGFRGALSGEEVARTVGRLDEAIRAELPEVKRLFIQPAQPVTRRREAPELEVV